MIRLVELRNWRSYEDATIDLSSRVVFFVAPNGVGKSSLVEAIRWCLLGEPAPRRAKTAVRLGSRSATIGLEVSLGKNQPELRIERSITETGKVTFSASEGGSPISESDYRLLLADRWSADFGLIDRLMFTDPQLPVTKSGFPVRDHLAATLGVTPLLDAAARLEIARREAGDRVAALRLDLDASEVRLASFEESTSTVVDELEAFQSQRQILGTEILEIETVVGIARQWDSYRDSVATHNDAVAVIVAELEAVVEINASTPQASLDLLRSKAAVSLTNARQARTGLEIAKAKLAGASGLLAERTDTCPTCLRPLSEHERSGALAQHGNAISLADTDTSVAEQEETTAKDRLEVLTAFTARLAALPVPSTPVDPDPGANPGERLVALRERDIALSEEVGRLGAVSSAEVDRVALNEQRKVCATALQVAAYKEQLLLTTVAILNSLADKTLRDRIDPLIEELSTRWKVLFGAEGLTLEPSGDLAVRSTLGTLNIADLSGGERATAVLIARLLITAATTQIPTIFFDEPLEHLDPRRRAAVARTLVRAGQTGTIFQLIVTTYEDRIARQLAAADPNFVRVVHADGPRKA